MNCRITIYYIVLLSLQNLTLDGQPNRFGLPLIQNYHYAETGGGEQNWGITQDRRGVIYVANNDNGILEFDGSTWRTYPVPGNVPVRSVIAGDDGYIYAGLQGDFGRLEPNRLGHLQYRSLLDSAQRALYSDDNFWKTYYSGDKVYSCGRMAILVFDLTGSRISIIDPPENSALTFFIGPRMYISNTGRGLMKYDGKVFQPVNGGGHLKGRLISGVVPVDQGNLLISTFYNGLYLIDSLRGTVDSTFLPPAFREELLSAVVIYLQKAGRDTYIGTRERGLFILNERWEVKERYSVDEGLLDNAIPYFIVDSVSGGGHMLWIAHWQGVSRVDISSPFRSVSIGPRFGDLYGRGRGEEITDMEQMDGDLYISTHGGLLQHQYHRENMLLRPVRGIRGEVNDLQVAEPSPGTVFLMAAGNERTYILGPDIRMTTLPAGGRVLLIDRIDPAVLYTGGDLFRSFRYDNGRWDETLKLETGSGILGMCQDRYGLIWLSTRTGLYRLELNGDGEPVPELINTENSATTGPFEVFTEPVSQELLVGSREGFFSYDYLRGVLTYDSLYNSILPEGRNRIEAVHGGSGDLVWISYENEYSGWNILAASQTDSGFRKVHDRVFESLPPRFSTSVFYTDPDGQTWFNKGDQLFHFDETRAGEDRDSLDVLIRRVRIAGDSLLFDGNYFISDPAGGLRPYPEQTEETVPGLKHHYRDIEFQWSAPYYRNERQIRYTCYLEGFSREWSEWSNDRSVKYTNLPYGKYVLQVKARNVFGDESPVSAYVFSILKPWFATFAAILLYIALVASLVIFVFLYTRRLRSRAELLEKQNKEIERQKMELEHLNAEITNQRDEIELPRDSLSEQNDLIDRQKNALTDSIIYARRIQDAVLPAGEVLRYLLPKHFVFYQPRDIVSGDFYWIDKKDEIVMIAVADCTGHGIPGAFMSMLGISLLNEVSGKLRDIPTNEVMDELRDQVMNALGQTGDKYEARDGIEMSLVAINTRNREIQFTGANQDLYTFQKGELVVIKGDRMPVGIHSEGVKPFSVNTIRLNRGDTLYLFTDGYPDQFGGPGRKKFGTSRLKNLLTGLQTSIMHDQMISVENAYKSWRGNHEQIDDVLMVGIKV